LTGCTSRCPDAAHGVGAPRSSFVTSCRVVEHLPANSRFSRASARSAPPAGHSGAGSRTEAADECHGPAYRLTPRSTPCQEHGPLIHRASARSACSVAAASRPSDTSTRGSSGNPRPIHWPASPRPAGAPCRIWLSRSSRRDARTIPQLDLPEVTSGAVQRWPAYSMAYVAPERTSPESHRSLASAASRSDEEAANPVGGLNLPRSADCGIQENAGRG